MYTILLVIHTIIVVFLILMVLLQRTDSDGLSGLGGGGGNQFMTGRGAANLMTRTTSLLAAAFYDYQPHACRDGQPLDGGFFYRPRCNLNDGAC